MENNEAKNSIDYKILSIVFFLIIIVLIGIIFFLSINPSSPTSESNTVQEGNTLALSTMVPSSPSPIPSLAPESIVYPLQNKEYVFQLKDSTGSLVEEFTYLVLEYELTNQVVLNKLYKALVTNDKEILVLHVDITNNTDKAFQIVSGDYLRLIKDNEGKLIAPDIEDDPIEVRPHSTASTSLGFTINKSDTNLQIQVGELGVKEDIIPIQRTSN